MLAISACVEPDRSDVSPGFQDPEHYQLVHEIGTGSPSDTLTFWGVVGGGFDTQGRLYFADGMERRFLRTDFEDGRIEVVGGGAGEGPGEFQQMGAFFGVDADGTIRAVDRLSGRVTVVDPERQRATATARVRDYFFAPPVAAVGPEAMLHDGTLLIAPYRPEFEHHFPDTLTAWDMLRVDTSSGVLDTLFTPPPAALGLQAYHDTPGVGMTVRFLAETPLLSVSPRGTRVGFLHRRQGLDEGTIGTLYLLDVSSDRTVVDTISVPGEPMPGTEEVVVERIGSALVGAESRGPIVAELLARYELPEWISTAEQLRLDSEGAAWVAVEDPYQSPRRWIRKRAGEPHWTPIETDRPITRVIDARGDRLAGVLMDSLRVQTLGIFERVR